MDLVTGAVVAMVLFFASIPVSILGLGLLGGYLGNRIGNSGSAVLGGMGLGWLVGFIWSIIAFAHGIIQIVRLVQLLN